jgi:hypothetical protein
MDSDQDSARLEGELREIQHEVYEDTARLDADKRREHEIEDQIVHEALHNIIVNGREKHVMGSMLSFDQVVRLAFDPAPSGPNVVFTVTFRRGPAPKPEGTLAPGEVVTIKDGEIFNVTCTDKS